MGLPSSKLIAKTEWHSALVKNTKALLATIEKQHLLQPIDTVGNKLAKTGLPELPLNSELEKKELGIRVKTVHKVKGESIGAVLFITKKENIQSLLSGTNNEEGRIGYVAVTRAKNLFWLAIPHSNIKEFRPKLLATGFIEIS